MEVVVKDGLFLVFINIFKLSMKLNTIHSDYDFRARPQQSYNPDNEYSPALKRRRRKIGKARPRGPNHLRITLVNDCDDSSFDQTTVVTHSSNNTL